MKAKLLELDGCVRPPAKAPAQPTIINQKLFDYLKANPEIRTVQQLITKS